MSVSSCNFLYPRENGGVSPQRFILFLLWASLFFFYKRGPAHLIPLPPGLFFPADTLYSLRKSSCAHTSPESRSVPRYVPFLLFSLLFPSSLPKRASGVHFFFPPPFLFRTTAFSHLRLLSVLPPLCLRPFLFFEVILFFLTPASSLNPPLPF